MNFETVIEFDDLIILKKIDPDDEYSEYYMANPWLTIIHHWIGVQEPMKTRDIRIDYDNGEFDRFITKYCF